MHHGCSRKNLNCQNSNRPITPKHNHTLACIDILDFYIPEWQIKLKGQIGQPNIQYASVWIKQKNRLVHTQLHRFKTGPALVDTKYQFESRLIKHNIVVNDYRADNRIFRDKIFQDAIDLQNQNVDFTGVNAHHQNGSAEFNIGTLQDMTRKSLIHAISRWSKVAINYWSFAILYNTKIVKVIPRRSLNNHSPITAVTH